MSNPNPKPNNLKPRWKKGESGNPAGRPKSKFFTDELKRQLEIANSQGETALELIVQSWIREALGGSYPHLAAAIDRIDGKVSDTKDTTPGNELFDGIAKIVNRHTSEPEAGSKKRPR